MGRALIADPDSSAVCTRGPPLALYLDNKCVAEMDRGGVRCVL
jgi:hypothetical protein